jgi:replicative DNA helicase
MNDLDLLFVFRKKEIYDKYSHFVQEHTVSKEVHQIIKDMGVYFSTDVTRLEIEWSSFLTWFKHKQHPTLKTELLVIYEKIFDNLTKILTSPVEKELIEAYIEKDYLTRIADTSLRGAEGTKVTSINDVQTLCDEYNTVIGSVLDAEKYLVTEDIHDLLSHVRGTGGLNWRLNELNLALGPLRKGDFITLTARPDSGKTTMLAAESTYMAKQLQPDQTVLWFNNEEEGKKVKFRIIQAAIGWPSAAIEANPVMAYNLYEKEVGSLKKILIYDRPAFSYRDVHAVLKDYNPGLIIFDQLRKVKGFEKEGGNDVGRLQLLFQQAREWAKEFAPVINVHQARGDAEGQRWIELNQMHGSQTDIQGEVDAVVSLGRTHEPGFEKSRFLYTPKNKMAGGPKSDEKYRNGKFEVEIDAPIARFKGTI